MTDLLRRGRPDEVGTAVVSQIVLGAGLSAPQTRALCLSQFSAALRNAIRDGVIDDTEHAWLTTLRSALSISDREITAIEAQLLHPRLDTAIATYLSDRHLSDAEKSALDQLAQELRVSEDVLTRLTQVQAQAILQDAVDRVLDDRRYSPDEEQAIRTLAGSVGGELTVSEATQRTLDRYRRLWHIDNGELESIPVDITLFKGERCYLEAFASWYELRTRTTSISYGGPVVSIRIAKGIRYRLGNVTPIRHTKEELTLIDSGSVYITDRRVIFMGSKRNSTLRFTSLLGFTPYTDGVELEKSTGRSPVLTISGADIDVFHAVLAAAMAATASS
jgi:AraC-like DNA-binding protein